MWMELAPFFYCSGQALRSKMLIESANEDVLSRSDRTHRVGSLGRCRTMRPRFLAWRKRVRA
jgi:hypothetical protein